MLKFFAWTHTQFDRILFVDLDCHFGLGYGKLLHQAQSQTGGGEDDEHEEHESSRDTNTNSKAKTVPVPLGE